MSLSEFKGRFTFSAEHAWKVTVLRQAYATAYFEALLSTDLLTLISGPCAVEEIRRRIQERDGESRSPLFSSVLPEWIYEEGASRIAGTYVEVHMPDHESALKAYDLCVSHYAHLCQCGNALAKERVKIYEALHPDAVPVAYGDWGAFYRAARDGGIADTPDASMALIRLTTKGTIRFGMFGSVSSIDQNTGWAYLCHAMCKIAVIA